MGKGFIYKRKNMRGWLLKWFEQFDMKKNLINEVKAQDD